MKSLSDTQMLKELIELAVSRGFTPYWKHAEKLSEDLRPGYMRTIVDQVMESHRTLELIFSHDFAKAVYGVGVEDATRVWVGSYKELKILDPEFVAETRKVERWQINLQQQVLCDNPLLYMYEHIKI